MVAGRESSSILKTGLWGLLKRGGEKKKDQLWRECGRWGGGGRSERREEISMFQGQWTDEKKEQYTLGEER